MTYLLIFIGGGLGSIARFAASGLVARLFGETCPWGTILVNVTGSFLIGMIAAMTGPDGRWLVSPSAREFLMIGVLGGYTTFSSFSLQTLTLARDGEWLHAGANVLLSVALCLVAVWLGCMVAANFNSAKGP
ncbi:MAG TPA: fluoride efflux transporter CrcB [Opitutaceae bacterium]|nr:fluoride efflux transporter CrcB [Opitutaceae bacterium]